MSARSAQRLGPARHPLGVGERGHLQRGEEHGAGEGGQLRGGVHGHEQGDGHGAQHGQPGGAGRVGTAAACGGGVLVQEQVHAAQPGQRGQRAQVRRTLQQLGVHRQPARGAPRQGGGGGHGGGAGGARAAGHRHHAQAACPRRAQPVGQHLRPGRRGAGRATLVQRLEDARRRTAGRQQLRGQQRRHGERRVPVDAGPRLRGAVRSQQQPVPPERVRRVGQRRHLPGRVPQLLRQRQGGVRARRVALASRDHRAGRGVVRGRQPQRQDERRRRVHLQLPRHPSERAAERRRGRVRRAGVELLRQPARRGVGVEEGAAFVVVAHGVQRVHQPVGGAGRAALAPAPAHLAAQAQGGVAQPVLGQRVIPRQPGREDGGFGGAHVMVTDGLLRACCPLTRTITRSNCRGMMSSLDRVKRSPVWPGEKTGAV